MNLKFKTVLFVVLATTTLVDLSATAKAQTPQSCLVGKEYLGAGHYEDAVDNFSRCLMSKLHTKTSRALAYYSRALAYYYLYYEEEYTNKNEDKAYKILIKASDDIEKSIELDPTGNAKAYCVRGWVELEGTWGFYGYEDLDKGIAMGASKDWCG